MAKEVPGTWLLSVSAACCPQPCSSLLDFSQHSIYYLADLLKVISEPSGPARWPERGGLLSGQTDWKIQMDTLELLKHTGWKQTENTACIIKKCIGEIRALQYFTSTVSNIDGRLIKANFCTICKIKQNKSMKTGNNILTRHKKYKKKI